MGIPKFFRWMSERYPSISQLIADNRIPEFDALYLDMNGIIHNCSHKGSDDATFRLTEDKIFIAIFNYIEHLFATIKPRKLFFMAIDGVAPRAKMNQQRARRFRTALDAERARDKAIAEGIELPKEDPFDSNCITPGTEFMARLTMQLKYFVNKKISEDSDWQGVEIVLSGHEVPGEGEHKIMEYIRQAKAQADYDPNRRHCLYGLDADLIMLGLLSHDPHFCLLREEVTFGRKSGNASKELEHQNFYLMHLCLVREFLELEFQELKEPGHLSFGFDMERVIDDFILMAFFIGNDFLPNLPHLHINEGALALMFAVYKNALPKMKGYVNEGGVINVERLGQLLDELSHVEYRFFEAENSDAAWFKSKQMKGKEDVMTRQKRKGQLTMSSDQQKIFNGVKEYVNSRAPGSKTPPYDLPVSLPARDRKFAQELAEDLNLHWATVEDDDGNRFMQLNVQPPKPLAVDGTDSSDDEIDEEAQRALTRVLKRYETAKVVDVSPEDHEAEMEKKYQQKFQEWKNEHYTGKFGWGLDNEEEMKKLTENYVQGLQWVLYYYYQGVASWPWFYKYHYSPMISDVKKGLGANMQFQLGQPFRPFQQLMGVLPDRSKKIVPTPYWDLMTNKDSPIIDFYPREFDLDMNGKKQDWEAVVKIPFIDEDRLLPAMATKDHLLTADEVKRNDFGVSLSFTYNRNMDFTYPSSLPGYFPDIEHCKCIMNIFDLPTMQGLEYFHGLMPGVKIGKEALAGFPSLKTLPYGAQLGFHGVSVFQQESRNESMVITILGSEESTKASNAQQKLGKAVYVGYPFLQEGKVVRVSDELFTYELGTNGQIIQNPKGPKEIEQFRNKADRIENRYSRNLGTIIGPVESLIHIEPLKGMRKEDDGAVVKNYGEIIGAETDFATQTVVDSVVNPDPRFIEKPAVPVEQEFPIGSRAFFLGEFAYGRPLEVVGHEGGKVSVWVSVLKGKEPEFGYDVVRQAERFTPYTPSFALASTLRLHPLALSKLTSSLSVESSGLRLNLGLNLKFEAKKLKVLGYSRKADHGWEYSQKAIELITQYMIKFPEFIAGISQKPKGDIYVDTDFYPQNVAKEKIKEIGNWLKSMQAKNFDKVPLDAEQLDSDAVAAIQAAADANLMAAASQQEPKHVKNIPRNAMLNPLDADQRIGIQQFTLGDRLVYVLQSGKVPIAQRGTVVGITRTSRQLWLDVVFDTTFMGGTTLGGRCRPFSGATVPAESVLNLSYRQIAVGSAAGAARKPPPQHTQGYGNGSNGAIGAPGGPRLVPANAPAPLTGSFRGAVSGQANGVNGHGPNGNARGHHTMAIRGGLPGRGRAGFALPRGGAAAPAAQGQPAQNGTDAPPSRGRGRGRGGLGNANRGGYTIIDNSDPLEGVNTRNRPMPTQSYNAVPPPANVNTPRGGRGGFRGGRGGGGDRGDGSRGRGRGRGRGGVGSAAPAGGAPQGS